jgi:hypothetical protein
VNQALTGLIKLREAQLARTEGPEARAVMGAAAKGPSLEGTPRTDER